MQVSVVTTYLWIQLNRNEKLQEDANFIQGKFLMNKGTIKKWEMLRIQVLLKWMNPITNKCFMLSIQV